MFEPGAQRSRITADATPLFTFQVVQLMVKVTVSLSAFALPAYLVERFCSLCKNLMHASQQSNNKATHHLVK